MLRCARIYLLCYHKGLVEIQVFDKLVAPLGEDALPSLYRTQQPIELGIAEVFESRGSANCAHRCGWEVVNGRRTVNVLTLPESVDPQTGL